MKSVKEKNRSAHLGYMLWIGIILNHDESHGILESLDVNPSIYYLPLGKEANGKIERKIKIRIVSTSWAKVQQQINGAENKELALI